MYDVLKKISKYHVIKSPLFMHNNTKVILSHSKQLNLFLLNFNFDFLNKGIISNLNVHAVFYNLILKKWIFFNTHYRFYAVIYNYFVFKTLYQVSLLIAFFRRSNKNILFITDDVVESLVSFRSLNFLTLNENFSALVPFFSTTFFWVRESNEFCNSYFLSKQTLYQKFDLVVILCNDYSQFNRHDLRTVSRCNIGLVNTDTNPSLFDIFIPVIKNKFITLQIFKELLFAQLLIKF